MIAKTFGGALVGIDALSIRVETSIELGVNFMLVGLPDIAVKESHYRIATALQQTGYHVPGRKIIINMAPADLRKEGAAYDLTLAIGILAASNQIKNSGPIKNSIEDYMIMGELSLDGYLQPIKGALSLTIEALKQHFKGIILPIQNAKEAAIVNGIKVYGATKLTEVIDFFKGYDHLQAMNYPPNKECTPYTEDDLDFSDVKGQEAAKRALEITAAGGHNILLIGPPGSGKTMLAKRLPSILPPLSLEEALETTKIHSVAGKLSNYTSLMTKRPFRDPHHTISYTALVGGGSNPQPGEISLAHNGVLFLDELPEFTRTTLEVLRQPLEDRHICISRAKMKVEYPAGFMLVASMNPCPCGYYNSPSIPCTCKPDTIQKYLNKISGPLLDRIDLQIQVSPVKYTDLAKEEKAESSAEINRRVMEARRLQDLRFKNSKIHCNAQMNTRQITQFCVLSDSCKNLLEHTTNIYHLSARAYHRILKVARTIADLKHAEVITEEHIAEAIHYRCLDKGNWGEQNI
ncbi:MAG: YifB family Mg chelatase-like AAA ATPase [Bacteroidales bacterium]